MRVPLKHLEELGDLSKYQLFFNRRSKEFAAIYNIVDKQIVKTYQLTNEYLNKLKQRNITEVSILGDEQLLQKLRENHPDIYVKPTGKISLDQLIIKAQTYLKLNQKSKKIRKITLLQDIYCSGVDGSKILAVEYGSVLGERTIEILKNYSLSLFQDCEYKDSENGVLVFVPDVKNFKLKVDLFAIISSLDYQIFDASVLQEAMQIYITKQPKLVVFGNLTDSIESKELLLELEDYDPYVKKLNYDVSPASNRIFETERIKKNYESGYEKVLEAEKKEKEMLPDEIKNTIIEGIKSLQNNWSKQNYIEKAYALKQFGRAYNITAMWNILTGIKRDKEQKIER